MFNFSRQAVLSNDRSYFSACGGMVTNASQQISNPVTQSAVECIWIIKVPANGTEDSVNIVSANLSVTGYNQSTK